MILKCFTEGLGVNATARMADVSKNTVLKLLADLGPVCAAYHRQALTNLKCQRIECDEIWAFCHAKEKNVPADKRNLWGYADVWTWTALDSDSKLVVAFRVDERDTNAAWHFMQDVAGRLANRVQLTTDGHRPYLQAVRDSFGNEIDYAMLVKIYGTPTGASMRERKYSPGECCGTQKDVICGKPDPRKISTSYVERLNLEIRTKNRRLTRLTNGFSRKVVNLEHSLAIGFMVYNFVRIHGTLKVTPAMEAKVTDRLWSYKDVIELLERAEATGELQGAEGSN